MAETENEPQEEPTTEPNKPESGKEESRTLTQDEINKLIEAARKQEKDKLYETISSLKDKVEVLSEAQKLEKQDKERIEKAAKEEADKERQAKMSAEDRLAEQLKKFEERLVEEEAERQKLRTEIKEERHTAELERYKNEVLNKAGDKILRELVTGNSKEEIDNSVATAQQKYQDYFQAAVKNAEGDPGRKLSPELGGKLPGPADPDPDPMDEEGLRGLIPKVDPYQLGDGKVSDEYKKNREEILSRVASVYNKSNR